MAKRVKCRAVTVTELRGLAAAARELGCSKAHLRWVVRGERPSIRLLKRVRERYPDLLAAGRQAARAKARAAS